MARNDKEEFKCMVGESTLVSWCLGELAGPGMAKVSSLNEWLDLWLDIPEEQWATYDGEEIVVENINNNLAHELDTLIRDKNKNLVMYRTN